MKTRIVFGALLGVCMAAAQPCGAQNSLSNQGFGYPLSGLSARSLTNGGATAEVDALSSLNPGALARWGRAGLAAQFAPEVRKLRGPEGSGSTTTMRFPAFAAATTLGDRFTLGASSSTLLDQSWSARFDDTDVLNGTPVSSTTHVTSTGAINDIRVALAGSITSSLSAGVAMHFMSGSNDIVVTTDYSPPDILDANLRTSLGYSGRAWSGGLVWSPASTLSLGISARSGSTLRILRQGEELSSASVPSRFGASVLYTGLGGALLAGRFERVSFSDMNGLGSAAANAVDTEDVGVGAELPGPSILSAPSIVRLGGRWRDLPFRAGGANVSESSYSAGLGVSVAGGRALFDLGVVRVSRDNNSAFRESAWIITSGILIRP